MTDKTGNRRIAVFVLVLGLVLGMGLLVVLCGVGCWLIARQQARVAAEREVAEANLMQARLTLEKAHSEQAAQQVSASPLAEALAMIKSKQFVDLTHDFKSEVNEMSRSENALVVALRVGGVLLLTAVIPAVMPFAWMDQIHRQLGMGELPETPITGYLTRSLSAFYALHGVVVLFVSLDVRRYLPVVRCLAALCIVFGAGMIVLDVWVGMPLPWVLGEGPSIIVLGSVLLWLAGRVPTTTVES